MGFWGLLVFDRGVCGGFPAGTRYLPRGSSRDLSGVCSGVRFHVVGLLEGSGGLLRGELKVYLAPWCEMALVKELMQEEECE